MLHGLEISPLARIGKGFHIAHTVGLVIGAGVVIGDNVTVYQNVTLGSKEVGNKVEYPSIGNGVIIYPGSVVLGGITVGGNSIIGANSVALNDVNPNSVVVGSPAREIKIKEKTNAQ